MQPETGQFGTGRPNGSQSTADRHSAPSQRRSVPTMCPHCGEGQGTPGKLSEHVRFDCPVLGQKLRGEVR